MLKCLHQLIPVVELRAHHLDQLIKIGVCYAKLCLYFGQVGVVVECGVVVDMELHVFYMDGGWAGLDVCCQVGVWVYN